MTELVYKIIKNYILRHINVSWLVLTLDSQNDSRFLDNSSSMLGCLSVLMVVFSFVNKDLFKFAGSESFTIIFFI